VKSKQVCKALFQELQSKNNLAADSPPATWKTCAQWGVLFNKSIPQTMRILKAMYKRGLAKMQKFKIFCLPANYVRKVPHYFCTQSPPADLFYTVAHVPPGWKTVRTIAKEINYSLHHTQELLTTYKTQGAIRTKIFCVLSGRRTNPTPIIHYLLKKSFNIKKAQNYEIPPKNWLTVEQISQKLKRSKDSIRKLIAHAFKQKLITLRRYKIAGLSSARHVNHYHFNKHLQKILAS